MKRVVIVGVLLVGLVALSGCIAEPLTENTEEVAPTESNDLENATNSTANETDTQSEANESDLNETDTEADNQTNATSVSTTDSEDNSSGNDTEAIESYDSNESDDSNESTPTEEPTETDETPTGTESNDTTTETETEETTEETDTETPTETPTETETEEGDSEMSAQSEPVENEEESTETETQTETETEEESMSTETETETETQEEHSMSIEVLDATTEEPIEDARVVGSEDSSTEDVPGFEGETGSSGVLRAIEPGGTYEIKVTAGGYEGQDVVVDNTQGDTHQYVHLEPTDEVNVDDVTLSIRDTESDDSLEGVDVTGERIEGEGAWSSELNGTSTAEGELMFEDLPAGVYVFELSGDGYESTSIRVVHQATSGSQYYVDMVPLESAEDSTTETNETNESNSSE